MYRIELSIQEIVNDFYSLAENEGYLSGLAEGYELKDKDKIEYHLFMKNLINKYIPSWRDKVSKRYWEDSCNVEEKGIILSTILCDNFKEIFYKLV